MSFNELLLKKILENSCPATQVACTREKCEHFTGKKTDHLGWNCVLLHDSVYPPPEKPSYKPKIKFTMKLDTTFVEGKKHNTATFTFTFRICYINNRLRKTMPNWKIYQQMNVFFVSYFKDILPNYQKTLKGDVEIIFVRKDIEDIDVFLVDKETVKEHLFEELLIRLEESYQEKKKYYALYCFQEEFIKTQSSLDFLNTKEA